MGIAKGTFQDMPLIHHPLKHLQGSALSSRLSRGAHPENNDTANFSPQSGVERGSPNASDSGTFVHGTSKRKPLTELCHHDITSLLLVIKELSSQLQRLESDRSQLQNENRRLKKHLDVDRSENTRNRFLKSTSTSPKGSESQQHHDRWAASVDRVGIRGGLVFPQRPPEVQSNEENGSHSKWSGNFRRKRFQKRSQSCKSLDGQCAGGTEVTQMFPPKRSRSCSMIRTVIPEEPDLEEAETNEAKREEAVTVQYLESSQDTHILPPLLGPLQAEENCCISPTRSNRRTALDKNHLIGIVVSDEEKSFIVSPYSDDGSSSTSYHEESTGNYDEFRISLSALTLCLDELRLVKPWNPRSPQFSS